MKTREDGAFTNECPHKRIMQHHVPVHSSVIVLTGIVNNPTYPQPHLQLEVLTPACTEEQVWIPASSASVHLSLEHVDSLIADLQEQRLRMLRQENS